MRRLFHAAVLGVTLVLSSLGAAAVAPAWAQGASADDPVSVRMLEVTALIDEINAVTDFMGQEQFVAFADSDDGDVVLANLEALLPSIREARGRLTSTAQRLEDLPPLNSDVEGVDVLNVMATDGADLARSLDNLLGEYPLLADAIRRADDAGIRRSGLMMVQGSIAIIENQALVLTSRSLMTDRATSQWHSLLAQAEMYKAWATVLRGATGLLSPDAVALALNEYADQMDAYRASGLTTLAREESEVNLYYPSQRPGLRALYALERQFYDVCAEVSAHVRATANTANMDLSTEVMEPTLMGMGDPFVGFEARQQAISMQMMEEGARLMAIIGE